MASTPRGGPQAAAPYPRPRARSPGSSDEEDDVGGGGAAVVMLRRVDGLPLSPTEVGTATAVLVTEAGPVLECGQSSSRDGQVLLTMASSAVAARARGVDVNAVALGAGARLPHPLVVAHACSDLRAVALHREDGAALGEPLVASAVEALARELGALTLSRQSSADGTCAFLLMATVADAGRALSAGACERINATLVRAAAELAAPVAAAAVDVDGAGAPPVGAPAVAVDGSASQPASHVPAAGETDVGGAAPPAPLAPPRPATHAAGATDGGTAPPAQPPRVTLSARKADPRQLAPSSAVLVLKNLAYHLPPGELHAAVCSAAASAGVAPESIEAAVDARGHFSGIAFVAFASAAEAGRALLQLHGRRLGGRLCKCEYKRTASAGAASAGVDAGEAAASAAVTRAATSSSRSPAADPVEPAGGPTAPALPAVLSGAPTGGVGAAGGGGDDADAAGLAAVTVRSAASSHGRGCSGGGGGHGGGSGSGNSHPRRLTPLTPPWGAEPARPAARPTRAAHRGRPMCVSRGRRAHGVSPSAGGAAARRSRAAAMGSVVCDAGTNVHGVVVAAAPGRPLGRRGLGDARLTVYGRPRARARGHAARVARAATDTSVVVALVVVVVVAAVANSRLGRV